MLFILQVRFIYQLISGNVIDGKCLLITLFYLINSRNADITYNNYCREKRENLSYFKSLRFSDFLKFAAQDGKQPNYYVICVII